MATTKVTANVLADNSITQAKLADDAVGADELAASAVVTASIVDDAVTAAKLAANAVVNASIASGAAIDMDKLDGDSLASAITDFAQDDLVILSDTSDSGNLVKITTSNFEDAIFGNISGDATVAAGGALTIANNAIETAMINADAITGAKIADDAIDSEHYTDGSVDTAHLADGAITAAKIADGAIVAAEIADDAVTTAKLADSNVTAGKIADDAISYAKLGAEFTTAATISASDVDWATAAVHTKTLTANTTFTFSNVSTGMVVDLVITGNYTLTLPASVKEITGTYDGTVSNLIQIVSTNGNTEQWATISQEAV